MYRESEANKKYFKSEFSFFKVYENNGQCLDNDLMQKLFKRVQWFYTEDVQNPVGVRNLEKISDALKARKHIKCNIDYYSTRELNVQKYSLNKNN